MGNLNQGDKDTTCNGIHEKLMKNHLGSAQSIVRKWLQECWVPAASLFELCLARKDLHTEINGHRNINKDT
jgi:hypothetical protein